MVEGVGGLAAACCSVCSVQRRRLAALKWLALCEERCRLVATLHVQVGLLAAGQSSTMTGTYAGQFVMGGFLDLKVGAACGTASGTAHGTADCGDTASGSVGGPTCAHPAPKWSDSPQLGCFTLSTCVRPLSHCPVHPTCTDGVCREPTLPVLPL